ncbi:MAG TPA: hypothetical protein VFG47_11560, partial [Geminicoccaceae bacterium]|nr:hypothetical protein [Geminicoccaceae bacterium]
MPPEVARLMGQVQDAGAQLAALRTENDRLRAEMEVRAQRRDVLLGERAQLEKQLAERDRRLAELEREIGALRAGAVPSRASGWPAPGGVPPRLAGVVAATRRLLASLGGGGRPVAEAAAPWHARPVAPARTEAPLVPFVAEGRTPRT